MEKFDFIPYMRDCALRLKSIQHSASAPRFFRISGLRQLEELLSSLPEASTPALMVENNTDGRVGDFSVSDNFLDIPYHVFYVISKANFNDHEAIENAKKNTKAIGFKILGRMLRDRNSGLHGLIMVDMKSISYQTVGPIGDNCYGTMFSFNIANAAGIKFIAEDWLPAYTPL